jgi:hypothetical protein
MNVFDDIVYDEPTNINIVGCENNVNTILYSIIALTNCVLLYLNIQQQCQTETCKRRNVNIKRTILETIESCILRMLKNGNNSEDEYETQKDG